MHNGLKNFLIFSLGAAAGAVVTWKLLKTTYERIAQEEIDSVYEEFSMMRDAEGEPDKEEENPDKAEYNELIEAEGYSDSNNEEKGGSEPMIDDKPRIIPADEFEEHDDYDIVSLTLYADGVLTNWLDDKVEDIDKTVGADIVEEFKNCEEDTMYVVNDSLRTYYELSRDTAKYSDIVVPDDSDGLNSYVEE